MKKWIWMAVAAVGFSGVVCAESVTNNLDVQGGFIYNHGAINPGDAGMTFTSAGIRDVTISVGQLSGVDPETGAVITNAADLLSLRVESLTTVSNVTAGGTFVGDGSGLTNLNVNSFVGTINASSLPTSGIWNVSGVTITNAAMAGQASIGSLTVTSSLKVKGTVAGSLNMDGNAISNAGNIHITGDATISNAVVAKQFRVFNSTIGSYSESSTILAGSGNTISNKVYNSAIVAGVNNAMSGTYSFIGSGLENKALDDYTVIGGGRYNRATNEYAFIGGGRGNHSYGKYSTIAGGYENAAEEQYTSVGGGYRNEVYAEKSGIAGGGDNEINAPYGFIGGGRNNRINGTNLYISILGGVNNVASGYSSVIAGGEENTASGKYSFSAGRYSRALHEGAFVWSDSSTNVFQSVANNEFAVYARGGIRLAGGRFIGDGFGLTQLNATNLVGMISISNLPPGALQSEYSDADAVSAVEAAYPNLAEAVAASDVISIVSSNGFATTNQLAALTATDVGAYTTNETDTAISNALSGIQVSGYVATNHTGDVSINGSLSMSSNRVVNVAAPVEDGDAVNLASLKALLQALPAQGDLNMGSFTNGVQPVVQF